MTENNEETPQDNSPKRENPEDVPVPKLKFEKPVIRRYHQIDQVNAYSLRKPFDD
jgi:hypothetical protein